MQIWGDSGPVEEHILLVENIIEVDPAEEKKKKEKMKNWSKTMILRHEAEENKKRLDEDLSVIRRRRSG